MHDEQITAALPLEVAQEVIDAGTAFPIPATRTGLPLVDIAVTGLSVITTVITLAQAPTALEDVARRLAKWRHRTPLSSDPVVSVDAVGPNGRISIQLTSVTSEDEVAHAISLVLTSSDAVESAARSPSVTQNARQERSDDGSAGL